MSENVTPPIPALAEARKALRCLYIAVDEYVAADVSAKVEAAFAEAERLLSGAVYCIDNHLLASDSDPCDCDQAVAARRAITSEVQVTAPTREPGGESVGSAEAVKLLDAIGSRMLADDRESALSLISSALETARREADAIGRERDYLKLCYESLAERTERGSSVETAREEERERCARIIENAGPTPNPIDLAAAVRSSHTSEAPAEGGAPVVGHWGPPKPPEGAPECEVCGSPGCTGPMLCTPCTIAAANGQNFEHCPPVCLVAAPEGGETGRPAKKDYGPPQAEPPLDGER